MNGMLWNLGDQFSIWCLNVLLQVGWIAGLALAIGLLLRRSPAVRYWLLCTALVLVCLCPVLSASIQSAGMNLFSIAVLPEAAVTAPGASAMLPPESAPLASEPLTAVESPPLVIPTQHQDSISPPLQASKQPAATTSHKTGARPPTGETVSFRAGMLWPFLLSAVLVIWLGTAFILLLRLAFNCFRLAAITRAARPNTDAHLTLAFRQAWQALGVKSQRTLPELAFSREISGPVAVGIRTPRVILPEQLLEQVAPDHLQDIFIHELAHLARRDQLVILLQNFVGALFWVHPLVRLLNHHLALAREEVCDNYVLATTDAPAYSRTLLMLAHLLKTPENMPGTVGLFTSNWKLEQRVAGLLDEHRSRVTRLSLPALLLVCMLMSGTAALVTLSTVSLAVAKQSAVSQQSESPAQSKSNQTDQGVASKKSVVEKKTKPEKTTEEKTAEDAHFVYSGRVVNSQGQPVAAAKLFVVYSVYKVKNSNSYDLFPAHRLLAETQTNSDGTYRLEFDDRWTSIVRAKQSELNITSFISNPSTMIVVSAPGYAPEWISTISADPDVLLQFSLHSAGPTIEGRLVNPDGAGLPGVTVALHTLCSAKQGAVTRWLKELPEQRKQGLLPPDRKTGVYTSPTGRYPLSSLLIADTPGIPTKVVTDKSGRFQIPGLGADRLAVLTLSGPEIPTQRIAVVTREMQPVQGRSMGYRGPLHDTYYGARFTCVLDPKVIIEGTVRDRESGAPIAARLQVWHRNNILVQKFDDRVWKTDSEGHFRIDKIPAVEKLSLRVIPDADQPYFADDFELSEPTEQGTIAFDVKLRRGVLFRGRLTDRQTGKPVPNAFFDYYPLLSNKLATQYRPYQQGLMRIEPMGRRFKSAEDGTFTVVGIPGAGIIAVRIKNPQYLTAYGLNEMPQLVDGNQLKTFYHCFFNGYQSLKLVTVPPGETAADVDLQLDRGKTLHFEVTGPDGKLLPDFYLNRRPVHQQAGEPVAVSGFDPQRTRMIVFRQYAEDLGRTVTIAGVPEKPEVRRIKLLPVGAVQGQLVSANGEPLAEARVSIDAEANPGTKDLPNIEMGSGSWSKICDSQGRFVFHDLVVGEEYSLRSDTWRGQNFYDLPEHIQAKPGQTIDLGTVIVPDRKQQ